MLIDETVKEVSGAAVPDQKAGKIDTRNDQKFQQVWTVWTTDVKLIANEKYFAVVFGKKFLKKQS